MEKWLEKIKKYSACSDKVYIKEKDCYICSHCGEVFDGKNVIYTLDHYLPNSMGGMTNADNLYPLCRECNSKRGDKLVDGVEYYKFLTEEAKIKLINSISHQKVLKILKKIIDK